MMKNNRMALALVLGGLTAAGVAWAEDPPSPSPSPTPTPRPVVTGQVFNHVGGGIEKVTVTLSKDGREIGTAGTNHYGDFTIEAIGDLHGPATVGFSKEHYQEASKEVMLGTAAGVPFVDMELAGAVVLSGVVRDHRLGNPIPGAKVKVSAAYKDWSATSDEEGKFRIEALTPGAVELQAEAENYARATEVIREVESAGEHVVMLKPEWILTLGVVDEKGKPIERVSVEVLDETYNDYRHTLTGEDGSATIRALNYDTKGLKVRLAHDAYVSSVEFDRKIEPPGEGHTSREELVMKTAGSIVGRITEADGGEPLMGARVSVGEALSDYAPRAWSEFDGKYRITGVTPGENVVTVHLSGFAPQLETVNVRVEEESELSFRMTDARMVQGRVTDAEGKPLPGVHVTATSWRDHDTLGLRAMTNEEGRFEMIDAPQDAFVVSLYLRSYKPLVEEDIETGRAEFEFTLESDPRAAGGGPSGPQAGEDAPDFAVKTLDGESIKLADLRGKVVLLDFWATWCGPCVAEIPSLVEVHKQYGDRADFVMLGVSLDERPADVQRFVDARKMEWKHAAGKEGGAIGAAEAYGVVAIPAIYVIGPDGKIAAANVHGPGVQSAVATLLKDDKK